MATRRKNSSILALLAVGLVPLWLASCVPSDGTDPARGPAEAPRPRGPREAAGDNGTAGTTGVGAARRAAGGSTDPLVAAAPRASGID